jgi:hypothetical protein
VPGAEAEQRVSIKRRTRNWRATAGFVAAVWAAVLVVLVSAAPAFAVEGPTKLDNPKVTPRSGTPTTTIVFEVRYRNRDGDAPDHINVVIDGAAHKMNATGTSWKTGVIARWSGKLPAGTHTVRFEAADTRKFTDGIDSGSVTITTPTPAPTPTPTPTPKPTPKPTPTPTPAPRSTPSPQPTPTLAPTTTIGGGTGGSTGGIGGTGGSTGGTGGSTGSTDGTGPGGGIPSGSDAPGGAFVPGSGVGPGSGGTDGSSGGPGGTTAGTGGTSGASGTAGGAAGSTGGSGGVDATGDAAGSGGNTGFAGWGDMARALDVLGVRQSTTTTMLPMLVGTTTATAMAFAFAIFGKKRRDEEPPAPDEVLQASAARGLSMVRGSEVLGVVGAPTVAPPVDIEAGMPRWRRPSLIEARKADPTRYVAASAGMSFENGAVHAVEGRERRVIRYRVVRLLDAPDELRSVDIGQLDQGDEVQLLERSGAYWLVLCPDGRQGWLHKMTLGEVVTDEAPQAPWTPDVDDDVLSAFLAARARA